MLRKPRVPYLLHRIHPDECRTDKPHGDMSTEKYESVKSSKGFETLNVNVKRSMTEPLSIRPLDAHKAFSQNPMMFMTVPVGNVST